MTSLHNYWSALRFKLALVFHLKRYDQSRYFCLKGSPRFSFSQYSQDILILPLVALLLKKVHSIQILDIGANHPVKYSNSLLIEKTLSNVQTVAVDPLASMEKQWNLYRPSSLFVNCAVSAKDGRAYMKIPRTRSDMFSCLVDQRDSSQADKFIFNEVPTLRLSTIIKTYITHPYILFLDVEGHEEIILKQIPSCEVKPIIVVAENNSDGLMGSNQLRDSMIDNSYSYLGRLGPNDDIFIYSGYESLFDLAAWIH